MAATSQRARAKRKDMKQSFFFPLFFFCPSFELTTQATVAGSKSLSKTGLQGLEDHRNLFSFSLHWWRNSHMLTHLTKGAGKLINLNIHVLNIQLELYG